MAAAGSMIFEQCAYMYIFVSSIIPRVIIAIMSAKYDFTGALALVTGGASGLGRAAAEALAKAGATCVLADINHQGAQEAARALVGGDQHSAFPVDVSSESSVRQLAESIMSKYSGRCPSVVIHAGGILARADRQSVFEISAAEFTRVIDVNLKGTFLINKEFGGLMKENLMGQQGAAIVNFSSIAGRSAQPLIAEYCASKAGVDMITGSFGKELAQFGIRVNAVEPYLIETPMLRKFSEADVDGFLQACPSKRIGTSEEVADLCLFLASEQSSYINGQTIYITGGF